MEEWKSVQQTALTEKARSQNGPVDAYLQIFFGSHWGYFSVARPLRALILWNPQIHASGGQILAELPKDSHSILFPCPDQPAGRYELVDPNHRRHLKQWILNDPILLDLYRDQQGLSWKPTPYEHIHIAARCLNSSQIVTVYDQKIDASDLIFPIPPEWLKGKACEMTLIPSSQHHTGMAQRVVVSPLKPKIIVDFLPQRQHLSIQVDASQYLAVHATLLPPSFLNIIHTSYRTQEQRVYQILLNPQGQGTLLLPNIEFNDQLEVSLPAGSPLAAQARLWLEGQTYDLPSLEYRYLANTEMIGRRPPKAVRSCQHPLSLFEEVGVDSLIQQMGMTQFCEDFGINTPQERQSLLETPWVVIGTFLQIRQKVKSPAASDWSHVRQQPLLTQRVGLTNQRFLQQQYHITSDCKTTARVIASALSKEEGQNDEQIYRLIQKASAETQQFWMDQLIDPAVATRSVDQSKLIKAWAQYGIKATPDDAIQLAEALMAIEQLDTSSLSEILIPHAQSGLYQTLTELVKERQELLQAYPVSTQRIAHFQQRFEAYQQSLKAHLDELVQNRPCRYFAREALEKALAIFDANFIKAISLLQVQEAENQENPQAQPPCLLKLDAQGMQKYDQEHHQRHIIVKEITLQIANLLGITPNGDVPSDTHLTKGLKVIQQTGHDLDLKRLHPLLWRWADMDHNRQAQIQTQIQQWGEQLITCEDIPEASTLRSFISQLEAESDLLLWWEAHGPCLETRLREALQTCLAAADQAVQLPAARLVLSDIVQQIQLILSHQPVSWDSLPGLVKQLQDIEVNDKISSQQWQALLARIPKALLETLQIQPESLAETIEGLRQGGVSQRQSFQEQHQLLQQQQALWEQICQQLQLTSPPMEPFQLGVAGYAPIYNDSEFIVLADTLEAHENIQRSTECIELATQAVERTIEQKLSQYPQVLREDLQQTLKPWLTEQPWQCLAALEKMERVVDIEKRRKQLTGALSPTLTDLAAFPALTAFLNQHPDFGEKDLRFWDLIRQVHQLPTSKSLLSDPTALEQAEALEKDVTGFAKEEQLRRCWWNAYHKRMVNALVTVFQKIAPTASEAGYPLPAIKQARHLAQAMNWWNQLQDLVTANQPIAPILLQALEVEGLWIKS